MYTSGSIASSQGMSTKINEKGAIAKIRTSVGSDTVKHLKAFRIMLISLLTLSWYYCSCLHIQKFFFFLLSYEFKMLFQIFVSKVYRSVASKNNSL